MTTPSGTSLAPIDPQDITNNTIAFNQPTNLQTGETIVYTANPAGTSGNTPIGGLTDGGTYFVIATDSTHIKLAASYNDAIAGNAITLTPSVGNGTSQLFSAGQNAVADSARSSASAAAPTDPAGASLSTPVASGTTAAIDGGGTITASSVAVNANQQMNVSVLAGGASAGAVAVGVGLAVVTVDSNVSAYIGPAVAVDGLGGAGNLSITANRNSTISALGIAGSLSGFVSVGGAVAYVTDGSSTVAFLGADYSAGGVLEGSTSTDPMTVGGAGFANVTVKATQDAVIDLSVGALAVSAGAGLGAAIAFADIGASTTALIGDNAIVGAVVNGVTTPIGAVTVTASGTQDIEPYQSYLPMSIALGGGFLGGAAGVAEIKIDGATTAAIGDAATINANGTVDVSATGSATANVSLDGASIGAIAVGVVISTVTASPAVTARVGARDKITAGAITVAANGTVNVSADASPAAGGILAGSGGVVTADAEPVTEAVVGAGAILSAIGSINIGVVGSTTAQSTMTGGDLGGVAIGIGKANATINATELTDIGATTTLAGGTVLSGQAMLAGAAVAINSAGTSYANANSTGAGGGAGAAEEADLTTSETDRTTTTIEAGDTVAAVGELRIGSTGSMTGYSTPTGSSYGIVGTVGATASLTATQSIGTNILANTTPTGATVIEGGTLDVTANIGGLNVNASPASTAGGLVPLSTSTAVGTVTSTGTIAIDDGATLGGETAANFGATANALTVSSAANAIADGLGTSDAVATLSLTILLDVNAAAGVQVDTQALTVRSDAPYLPSLGASESSDNDGFSGSGSSSQTIAYDRTIEWNATVGILPAPNPILTINSGGAITQDVGVTTQPIVNGTLVVNPITNNPTAFGNVTFHIASSALDAENNTNGITTEATLTGVTVVNYVTSFQSVTVENNSTLNLHMSGIEPAVSANLLLGHVVINVPNGGASGFSDSVISTPVPTVITIQNTVAASGDILLQGLIDDPLGSTTIGAAAGSILEAAAGALIDAKTISLSAGKAIGGESVNGRVLIETPSALNATAGNGNIVLSQQGDLLVGTIAATGTADLLASGGIADATPASALSAPTMILTANGGAIGTSAASPLGVSDPGSRVTLTASATAGIFVNGGSTGLALGTLITTANDIDINDAYVNGTGQDITLAASSAVRAPQGNVNLRTGDNVSTAAGSTIAALGGVAISSDFGVGTVALATSIDLRGIIHASSATITGGNATNTISLTNVSTGTPTTINADGGNSTILIGSKATAIPAASDTGGVIGGIGDVLTVQGGSGTSVLRIDDTGDGNPITGVLTSTALTGLGMAGSIQYSNIATLALALGNGLDTLTVRSTAAATTTAVTTGTAATTVIVQGTDNTTNGIAGLLQVNGDGTNDTLQVNDTNDPSGTTGALTQSRITGLGMGTGNPSALGITYSNISMLEVTLGAGPDVLTIDGDSAQTLLMTGGGGDSVTVGPDLANFAAELGIDEGSGGNLEVEASTGTSLTLGQQSPGVGDFAISGVAAPIYFSGVSSLLVSLSGAPDTVTINATTAATTIDTGGGGDTVTVNEIENATTINLGSGTNMVTVYDAKAALTVNGGGGGVDTLTLDLSSTTAAVTAGQINDAGANTGVLHAFVTGDITFDTIGTVDVDLGTGNDFVTIDTTLADTAFNLDGGGGDDAFRVVSIGAGPAMTSIAGGIGDNTVTVVISGFPTQNEFANLNLNGGINTLIVDNSSNTTDGVAWTETDGQTLSANYTDPSKVLPSAFNVMSTASAGLVTIMGGTQSDTLTDLTDTTAGITGSINGNLVQLHSGYQILTPAVSSTNQYFPNAMSFDGLVTGAPTYSENGFVLTATTSANHASTFVANETTSIAAAPSSTSDQFTLTTQDVGLPGQNGGAFSLYALSLAATASGTQAITLTGKTLDGKTVTKLLNVSGGFAQYVLSASDGFTDLTSVSWTAGNTLVDNIQAVETFPIVQPATLAAAQTVFTVDFDPGTADQHHHQYDRQGRHHGQIRQQQSGDVELRHQSQSGRRALGHRDQQHDAPDLYRQSRRSVRGHHQRDRRARALARGHQRCDRGTERDVQLRWPGDNAGRRRRHGRWSGRDHRRRHRRRRGAHELRRGQWRRRRWDRQFRRERHGGQHRRVGRQSQQRRYRRRGQQRRHSGQQHRHHRRRRRSG